MGNKKDRLGGRYGGEPEKAIADPGNLDVKNPVEEVSQRGLHQYRASNKNMTKARQWASARKIPRHREYANAWIDYRTNKNPYKPSGEYISSSMKSHIRDTVDNLLLGESKMNLKDLVKEFMTETPGFSKEEKEPAWAKIYRLNVYDRADKMIQTLESLKRLTGQRPKPGKGWQLDDVDLQKAIRELDYISENAKSMGTSLKKYLNAVNK